MSPPPVSTTDGAADNSTRTRVDASSSFDDRRNSQEPSGSTSTQTNWRVSLPNVISNLFHASSPSSSQHQNDGASSSPSPAASPTAPQQHPSSPSAVMQPIEPQQDQDASMTDASLLTALAEQASASTPAAPAPLAAPGPIAASTSATATAPAPVKPARRSVAGGRKSSAAAAAAAARVGEKRTMPSRLRRVSSLLSGTGVGDALKDHQQRLAYEDHILPGATPLVITNDATILNRAVAHEGAHMRDAMSLFSDPEVAKACRAAEIIETPDFKPRDDTLVGGRTRGSLAEEDTSEEAYERRHRKPENAEKRVRKSEIDRLRLDRTKLAERLEQLREAGRDILLPLLVDRQQRATSGAGSRESKQQRSTTAAQATDTELEMLRKEMIVDLQRLIDRHDALLALPLPAFAISGEKRKSGVMFSDVGADGADAGGRAGNKKARQSAIAANSQRAANARGRAGGRKSLPTNMPSRSGASAAGSSFAKDENLTRAQKVRRAMSMQQQRRAVSSSPSKTRVHIAGREQVGELLNNQGKVETVFKEEGQHNIHARTSGGRFAPKPKADGSLPNTPKAAGPKKETPRRGRQSAGTSSGRRSGRRVASATVAPSASTPSIASTPAAAAANDSARSRRISGGRASNTTARRRASTPATAPKSPAARTLGDSPSVGITQERFNIVGRTKGGRFASKTELGLPGSTRRRPSSGTSVSRVPSTRSAGRRGEDDYAARANRTGPSLAEVAADVGIPKRVRLTFAAGSDSGSPAPTSRETSAAPKLPKPRKGPMLSATPAYKPAALSEEEAQRMLEAALAGDDDDGDLFGFGAGSAQPAVPAQIESPAAQVDGPAAQADSAVAQADAPGSQADAPGGRAEAPVAEAKSEHTNGADNTTDAAAPAEVTTASQSAAPPAASGAPPVDSEAASVASAAPEPAAAAGSADTAMASSSSVTAADASMASTTAAPQASKPVGGYVLERQFVPSRRESNRVKASSAFGEKLPEVLTKSEDFATMFEPMMQQHDWEAPKVDTTATEAAETSNDAQSREQVEASAPKTEAS